MPLLELHGLAGGQVSWEAHSLSAKSKKASKRLSRVGLARAETQPGTHSRQTRDHHGKEAAQGHYC